MRRRHVYFLKLFGDQTESFGTSTTGAYSDKEITVFGFLNFGKDPSYSINTYCLFLYNVAYYALIKLTYKSLDFPFFLRSSCQFKV